MQSEGKYMLYFENDYCEGAHPAILQKLVETNFEKISGYGTDPYCASAREKIRAACGAGTLCGAAFHRVPRIFALQNSARFSGGKKYL